MFISTIKITTHALGIVGDLMNLRGAYLLAREALNREEIYKTEKKLAQTAREHPEVTIIAAEVAIRNHEDVVLATMRKSAEQARKGFIWLIWGFVLLLVHRVIDAIQGDY